MEIKETLILVTVVGFFINVFVPVVCFIPMWYVLTFVAFVYLSKDIEFIY